MCLFHFDGYGLWGEKGVAEARNHDSHIYGRLRWYDTIWAILPTYLVSLRQLLCMMNT